MLCLQGVGTEGDVLVEIFSSRSNQEIKALTEAFLKGKTSQMLFVLISTSKACSSLRNVMTCFMFVSTETQKQLTTELEKKVSGDFSKALLLLAQVGLGTRRNFKNM